MAKIKAFPVSSRITAQDAEAELRTAGLPEGGIGDWKCTRAFNWWVVKSVQGLPLHQARQLHEQHAKTLLPLGQKNVKDVADFATGLTSRGIRLYHATSPEALAALVGAIKKAQPG